MAHAARRKTAPRKEDAVSLLKSDHEEVAKLFKKYENGEKKLSTPDKAALAKQICDALMVHTQIEEEIFYPACHEQIRDVDDLLNEAKVEHQSLKELIAKIEQDRPGTEEYDAQVKVLGEYVTHHVDEEHKELFPRARKSKMDLQTIGERLAARKEELETTL